jgi:hypothetical protein
MQRCSAHLGGADTVSVRKSGMWWWLSAWALDVSADVLLDSGRFLSKKGSCQRSCIAEIDWKGQCVANHLDQTRALLVKVPKVIITLVRSTM